MIAVPGLREEPAGELRCLFETWAEGDDALCFHTAAWWKALLEKECGNRCDISVLEAECGDAAWKDWFSTGHEYAIRDRTFLEKGLAGILNFSSSMPGRNTEHPPKQKEDIPDTAGSLG